MKKRNLLWVALVLALIAALAGCDDGFGLPGDAADVAEVFSFNGTNPSSQSNAMNLLTDVISYSNVISSLGSVNDDVFYKAFRREYGETYYSWLISASLKTSASVSVNFITEDNEAAKAQITGNSSFSASSNRLLGSSYTYLPGDTYSISSSINKKVDFRNTAYSSTWSPSYKICGIITVEDNNSTNTTIKSGDIYGNILNRESSISSSTKLSCVLSVTNGANSAKYKFSYAEESNGTGRYVEGGSTFILSDIEVYDNSNRLIFRIPSTNDLTPTNLTSIVNAFTDSPW